MKKSISWSGGGHLGHCTLGRLSGEENLILWEKSLLAIWRERRGAEGDFPAPRKRTSSYASQWDATNQQRCNERSSICWVERKDITIAVSENTRYLVVQLQERARVAWKIADIWLCF
jgi:hypothetical protein